MSAGGNNISPIPAQIKVLRWNLERHNNCYFKEPMAKTGAASLITPAQTADILSVSAATPRRYAKQFKKHLSKHAKAKRRQYTQKDLAVLTKVRDLIRGGANVARANAVLGTVSPTDEIVLPANAMNHAEIVSATEKARDQLMLIGKQFALMNGKRVENREKIAVLAAELKALHSRSFVDRLLNRMPATAR